MSSAAKVELYVSKRPYIKEALAEGIINYSALARKICNEEGLESLEAVKAALSRYEDHIAEEREKRKNKVEEVLDQTSLTVQTDVSVKKSKVEDSIIQSQTENGFTSVVKGGDKALISLESPGKLEDTPGVLEFILSSLSAQRINVDQFISCREDTHLVVDEKDSSEVLETLQNRLK